MDTRFLDLGELLKRKLVLGSYTLASTSCLDVSEYQVLRPWRVLVALTFVSTRFFRPYGVLGT